MVSAKATTVCAFSFLILLSLISSAHGRRSRGHLTTVTHPFQTVSQSSIAPECTGWVTKMMHNGTCNNSIKSKQGSSHTAFKLLFKPSNRDPRSNDYPSPRLVSNIVCDEPHSVLNSRGITEFWTYFGQILDHTIAETHTGNETMDIPIPADDYFFPKGGVLPFTRTFKKKTPLGWSPENVISSYVDGSSVYGVSSSLSDKLRAKSGGKMKLSSQRLLPKTTKNMFKAGDSRVNENPALQAMHTLFVREHNRVCDELIQEFPFWDDEKLYDAARLIVTAEFQRITFYEFVPAILGEPLPDYERYKHWIDGSISNEFATSIYRVGHTLINPKFTLYSKTGKKYTLFLNETFFKTDVLRNDNIDGVLRGILNTKAAEVDVKVTSEVRNVLTLGTPMKVDLVSLNIQRGRDHAIPPYNELRRLYGLKSYRYFSQITTNRGLAKKLQSVYGGDIEKIDPWIGGLAEDHHGDGSLGELFAKAWKDEFIRMRDGNRFYFENKDYFEKDILAKSKTVHILLHKEKKGGTMRRIILQNTHIPKEYVPKDVFRLI